MSGGPKEDLFEGYGGGQEGGRYVVLGIEDPWIILGYVLLFGSAIACVIYGWLKWNSNED